jgi:hypothetical protein
MQFRTTELLLLGAMALSASGTAPTNLAPSPCSAERAFSAAASFGICAIANFPFGSQQKKAAWFPKRPFLSYGGLTLAGDFRTSAPGAYLPAAS